MSNITRTIQILRILKEDKIITYDRLAELLNVSRATVRRDIAKLSTEIPINYRSGNGGGIYILKDWFYRNRYLTNQQELACRHAIDALSDPEDKYQMQLVIDIFHKPKQD